MSVERDNGIEEELEAIPEKYHGDWKSLSPLERFDQMGAVEELVKANIIIISS